MSTLDPRWVPLPDVADELGVAHRTVRAWLREGELIAGRVEGLVGARVPSAFLTGPAGERVIVRGLAGSITQLRDNGLDDDGVITWLLTANDELGESPAAALAAGRMHAVRRAAVLS